MASVCTAAQSKHENQQRRCHRHERYLLTGRDRIAVSEEEQQFPCASSRQRRTPTHLMAFARAQENNSTMQHADSQKTSRNFSIQSQGKYPISRVQCRLNINSIAITDVTEMFLLADKQPLQPRMQINC